MKLNICIFINRLGQEQWDNTGALERIKNVCTDSMYQAYIPGRGPYPALFPIPLAHPSPLRPGDNFLTGPGFITTTSAHSNAPILSIPSMAAFKAKMEKDNAGCLNLVKKDSGNDETSHSGQQNKNGQLPSSLKSQSHLQPQLQAANRPAGPAEFTRFTIDEILGKNEETHVKEDASDDDISCDEIEVVRCNTPDSESGKAGQESEEGESLVFGSANAVGDIGADDPSARFSWLQCTRYKPPKLPRKLILFC